MMRAIMGFNGLEAEEQHLFAERVFQIMQAGAPVPPFLSVIDEAAWWADMASNAELKAYIAAAVARLSPKDRTGLADYLRTRE